MYVQVRIYSTCLYLSAATNQFAVAMCIEYIQLGMHNVYYYCEVVVLSVKEIGILHSLSIVLGTSISGLM